MTTDELISRARHAKPEQPLQRAERLISELRDHGQTWNAPRHHATDSRWDTRKAIAAEMFAFTQRFALGYSQQISFGGIGHSAKQAADEFRKLHDAYISVTDKS